MAHIIRRVQHVPWVNQMSHVKRCSTNQPVHAAKLGFVQLPPEITNTFTADLTLIKFLKRYVPSDVYSSIEPDLKRFGERCATDILHLARECEQNPPYVVHFDAWGKRLDRLVTCDAWKQMKMISATESLVGSAYECAFGEHSRLYQMTKLFLFSPSSGLSSCPLAMTDGAAKTLQGVSSPLFAEAYRRLVTRDPDRFWTSGQWMTEKRGGSDVAGGTETVALTQSDGTFALHGYKWFSSATDSDICLTLARSVDDSGTPIPGTRGLSMYFVNTRNDDGTLNNMQIVRLKNKLGTRQLPTAELLLDGCVAHRVGEPGRGVSNISGMLTVTRVHNAVSSVSAMRRMVQLARSYSERRTAFDRAVVDWPLHCRTLAQMELQTRACLALCMEVLSLLGADDAGTASDSVRLRLRLLTPVLKLYTAKQAVWTTSEGLEAFGGQGYLEDTGLPGILRDAQVLPIWEGTTNVLSLDVLRALQKTKGEAWRALTDDIRHRLLQHDHQQLLSVKHKILGVVHDVEQFTQSHADRLDVAARDLAFTIAKTYTAALLYWHCGQRDSDAADVAVCQRWSAGDLAPVLSNCHSYNDEQLAMDRQLLSSWS